MPPPAKQGVSKIQSPKGTRDLYPEDALKRRYLEQSWRDASIRCGFEEIHGPTFETTDLYAVKSGEGILGELFQAYSGKAPEEVEQVKATGRAPYAMRPEFTPTLARMFAAKAGSLPRPCKWFTGGPYFRAERPQRGRLREFLQWNLDVIGDDGTASSRARSDAEVITTCLTLMKDIGLTPSDCVIRQSSRSVVNGILEWLGVAPVLVDEVLQLLDRRAKMAPQAFQERAENLGLPRDFSMKLDAAMTNVEEVYSPEASTKQLTHYLAGLRDIHGVLDILCDEKWENGWWKPDYSIVRGLAYYTGTVFEVLADGERAVAGGGRYDKLIELMGGPPTPAVGFAMGDVVVSLLLEDKGLMPQGPELMEAVSRRPASVRPEVFVVGADDEQSDALVRRLSADLRRGVEAKAYHDAGERKPWIAARYDPGSGGVRPMHARVSYKSTRNLKKLLADGEKQFARLAAIVHGPDRVQLKDFDRRADLTPKDAGLSDTHAEFSVDPASPVYVGRAAERLLG
ncbi:MAG: ATP phosphoribosyltransferase regulatory subunit [Phycisphaerales bacterium]|nr:ATP phosphoribosyltransferase regulatory subunit [Planctomycetota bacterium]MCH8509942.1 ATP phosphoribosyltransferase regulatory subunit [Phycisphaerales bacterium]